MGVLVTNLIQGGVVHSAVIMLYSKFHNHTYYIRAQKSCSSTSNIHMNKDNGQLQGSAHTGWEWSAPNTTQPFLPPLRENNALYSRQ